MSAHINQAPLKSVAESIKQKQDIWIKGDHYLEDKKISVEFDNLPIKNGIKRIFSTLNHSLMFDQDGKLLGIFIVGTQEKKWNRSSAAYRKQRRRPPHRRR